MRVLVTGASGFIGTGVCTVLNDAGFIVRAAVRRDRIPRTPEQVVIGDVHAGTDWSRALEGVDCVVHLAAHAHVLGPDGRDLELYTEVNGRGTRQLAGAAARAGVARFVYLSSVKVNGEQTGERPFTAADVPQPQDAYGQSKWLAEQYLQEVAAGSAMSCQIVRPPLVYGAGVRANFLRLMRWAESGWPIPLRSVQNARSLVSLWNLAEFLSVLAAAPAGVAGTWMISDGEDLSTPELLRRLALALARPLRLLPVPVPLLMRAARLLGRDAEFRRLCGSLVVDISQTRARLSWSPRISVDEGLARTVAWYRQRAV